MRFRDAAHLDFGPFYARLPEQGRFFRALGYLGVALAVWWSGDQARIQALAVVLVVAWVMAWRRTVGALWRSSLVAALVACAVILSWYRLHPVAPAPSVCPVAVQEAAP
jgi:hypothetical protein